MNKKISQQQCLRYLYKDSLRTLKKSVNSVHSNTLDEIYTSAYRPSVTHSGETFIKNLQTGKPEKVKLTGKILRLFSCGIVKRRSYALRNNKNHTLGTKSFGICFLPEDKVPRIFPGVINSNQNDIYAGVQIRLLQAVCELAKKYNIKSIPLISEPQALIFHTMMGFRPDKNLSTPVDSIQNLKKKLICYKNTTAPFLQSNTVQPILSRDNNKYFFDYNRTLFCDVLKINKEKLEATGQRHLGRTYRSLDCNISMNLAGKELDEWFERLKGFEILDENECIIPRKSIFQRIKDFFFRSTPANE